MYGDGKQRGSFKWVGTFVNALIALRQRGQATPTFSTSGTQGIFFDHELAVLVKELRGSASKFKFIPTSRPTRQVSRYVVAAARYTANLMINPVDND